MFSCRCILALYAALIPFSTVPDFGSPIPANATPSADSTPAPASQNVKVWPRERANLQANPGQTHASIQNQDRILFESALADADRLKAEHKTESNYQAVKKYEEALQYAQRSHDKSAQTNVLRRIGQVYRSLHESIKALAAFRQALELSKKLKNVQVQGALLNDIGQLTVDLGDNTKAMGYAIEARMLSQSIGDRRGIAQALNTIGDAHYNLGELRESINYYRQALQLCRDLKDRNGEIRALVSFGYAYLDLSEQSKALDSYQQGLALSRSEGDLHWEAVTLRAIGNLQTKLGENQKAIDIFLNALKISQSLDDRHLNGIILAGLGYAYEGVGEERKALDYYHLALGIFQAINHLWGESETRMDAGRVYHSLGDDQRAMNEYRRALALFGELKMPRYQAQTLKDLGLVYDSLGDSEKALECYKRSLKLTAAGQDQRYEAYTLNYMGRAYEKAGDKDKARRYYERALPLNRHASDPAGESLTLFNLARLERDFDNLLEARERIMTAHAIIESLRARSSSHDLRTAYFATVRQHYELYVDILMRLHKQRPAEGFDALAFETSEKARARSLLESLTEARAGIREGVDALLLERERSLQQSLNASAEHHARLLADTNSEEAASVARKINQLTTEYDEVRAQIRSTSPRYASLTQPKPLTLNETQQQALDNDSVLLEYMLGNERSYLWAVTRTEMTSYELPPRAEIEARASKFYELLKANQPVPGETFEQRKARIADANSQIPGASEALSKLVIAPVLSKIGNKRLIIVPDGVLQYIPFQALTVPASSNSAVNEQIPLLVDHEIVYEPSASALALVRAESARRRPAPKSVAVFANPVFEADDSRVKSSGVVVPDKMDSSAQAKVKEAFRDVGFGDRIPALPASREEADAIIAVAPWGTGLKAIGFDASRATVTKPELARYRIVHFATHGLVDYQHPELSGLVLSLVDQDGKPQDGFLRLHDIYNLKLSANLVVLSACNTGLGKEVRGEGLMGMTRGFMYAGATAVAASLWKVDDEATAELMKGFYEGMFRKGLTPAAALRESQLAMWRQKRWHAPYYWAAFTIQGQYDQIEEIASPKVSPSEWLVASAGVLSSLFLASCLVLGRRRSRIL